MGFGGLGSGFRVLGFRVWGFGVWESEFGEVRARVWDVGIGGLGFKGVLFDPLPIGKGTTRKKSRLSYWQQLKPRLQSGIDWRICSESAPQRIHGG